MAETKPIYFARHGQTTHNREGRIRAHLDVPLNDAGKRAAQRQAQKLSKLDVECVYCSPLKRSKATAEAIAKACKCEIQETKELLPWDLGSFAGKKISAILPQLDYYRKHPSKKVPGGEAYNDFLSRWRSFLRDQQKESREGEVNVIVTHARHMLSLRALLKSDTPDVAKIPVTGGPQPGAIICLQPSGALSEILEGDGETRMTTS